MITTAGAITAIATSLVVGIFFGVILVRSAMWIGDKKRERATRRDGGSRSAHQPIPRRRTGDRH